MTLLLNRPTKAARQLFGGPIYTKKKLRGNFLTPPFMPKSKKILLLTTKKLSRTPFGTLQSSKNYRLPISSSLPLEPCVFTFYPKSTNLIIRAVLSFLPAVVPLNSFRAIQISQIMAPIVKSLPSYIKDRQHALEIFRDFDFFGQDNLIFTMNISSLYTVILSSEGLLALKYVFRSMRC